MKPLNAGILASFAFGAAALFQAAPANAQANISGSAGFSIGMMGYSQTDHDEGAIVGDFAFDGNIGFDLGGWNVMLDVNSVLHRDNRGDFDHYAPWGVTSFGLHAGRQFGNAYVGGFMGGNAFQGNDASTSNGYITGTLWGIEGRIEPASMSGVSLFGQLGRANMVGDAGDTAFIGNFARFGADYDAGNGFGFTVAAEFGRSPNIFEDSGDWGEYRLATVEGRLERGNVIYSIGGEMGQFTANTEDFATSNRLFLKATIPFGPKPKRNLLKTPYGPGLAAAWAETLD